MKIDHPCWQCEYTDCGHTWLATDPNKPPDQCARCRRRGWHSAEATQNNSAKSQKKSVPRPARKQKPEPAKAAPAPIVERAVSMAQAKSPKDDYRTCLGCKGKAYHRLFAGDYWCPNCGRKVE